MVAFVVIALLVAKLYDTGVNRPSMVFKHIPKETKEWVNNLNLNQKDGGMDINATPAGPFNWENTDDYLNHPSSSMRKWGKQESSNVVVYHYKDKDAVWQGRARSVIQCVEEALKQWKELCGTCYSPEEMNGRKLPVYIADSTKHYQTIVRKLSSERATLAEMEENNGLLVMEVGPLGCQVKGIVLHPDCFKKGSAEYKQVIRRELARICFYASIDYNRQIRHFEWFSEGLAEYFSLYCPMKEQVDADMAQFIDEKCFLDREFDEMADRGLRAADCFFRFYADKKGYDSLAVLVQSAYVTSGDSLFAKLGMDTEVLKAEWMESIR